MITILIYLSFFVMTLFISRDCFAANRFEIAHLNIEEQDMIIIPLDGSFGRKSSSQQKQAHVALQFCASSAGLKGNVVLVWEEDDMFYFIAPKPWHSFFKEVTMEWVELQINKELTCGN